MLLPVLVVEVPTVTITLEVVVPSGFSAERWYVVVTTGDTVTDVLDTAPIPLSRLVELALLTDHERMELPPIAIEDGVAINEAICGRSGAAMVAEHELVATDEEASVASMVMVCMPAA